MNEPTICINCKYCFQREDPLFGITIFPSYLCKKHTKLQTDFVTGRIIIPDNATHCRNINTNGNCEGFEPKDSAKSDTKKEILNEFEKLSKKYIMDICGE